MNSIRSPPRRSVCEVINNELLCLPKKNSIINKSTLINEEKINDSFGRKLSVKSIEYAPKFQKAESISESIAYFNKASNSMIPSNDGPEIVNNNEIEPIQKVVNILDSSQKCGNVINWNVKGEGEKISLSIDWSIDMDEKNPQESNIDGIAAENLDVNSKYII